MTTEIQYYGMISDKLQLTEEQLSIDISSDINLRSFFEDRYPQLKELSYKIAVNQSITDTVDSDTVIREIALLPPFAGG